MSGRLLCKVAQEAPNVLFVKEKQYASTTLLLPKHQDKYNTGTMTRMQRHLSRHLLVVASGLSGRAQHAAMSGKAMFQGVCRMTADVLDAIEFVLSETSTNSQRLKQCNIHCCLNGILSATPRTAFIHKTPLLAAESWCTGSATNAPRDSCTCIK